MNLMKMILVPVAALLLMNAVSGKAFAQCSGTPTPDVGSVGVSRNIIQPNQSVSITVNTNESQGNLNVSILNSVGETIKNLGGEYLNGINYQQNTQKTYVWDGRNLNGNKCAPGVYLVVCQLPMHTFMNRVMVAP